MELKGFEKIRDLGTGYIADYYNDAGGTVSDYIMNIVAGIVPPVGFIPGYYLIIGMMYDQTPGGLYKLLFVNEHEDVSTSGLVSKFIDAVTRYHVETVYADKDGKHGFFAHLHNESIKYKCKYRLMPAPSVEDPLYGFALINQYKQEKAFNVPINSIFVNKFSDISIVNQNKLNEIKAALNDAGNYVFDVFRFILTGIQRDILPMARPGNVYDLKANRFRKPDNTRLNNRASESGFFV